MKKYFLLALVAFASIALVSCKKDAAGGDASGDGSTELKVVVNPKTADLTIGSQAKLRASLTPAKDGVAITFTSSNATVASVDNNGIVIALAEGTADIIASAEGATPDTCKVSVVDPYDAFAWSTYMLVDLGSEAISEEYEVTWQDGTKNHLKNYKGVFYLFDENIEYVKGTGLSGMGYITAVETAVAVIQDEGEEKGYYVRPVLFFDNSAPKDSAGVNPESYLGKDAAEWAKWLMDSTYINDDIFVQPINIWDWDSETTENDINYVGYIRNGWVGQYSNGFFYQMNIVWFDINYSYYFLKIAEVEDGKYDFVDPYEFGDNIEKYYEVIPTQGVKEQKPIRLIDVRDDAKTMQQISKKMAQTTRRMK